MPTTSTRTASAPGNLQHDAQWLLKNDGQQNHIGRCRQPDSTPAERVASCERKLPRPRKCRGQGIQHRRNARKSAVQSGARGVLRRQSRRRLPCRTSMLPMRRQPAGRTGIHRHRRPLRTARKPIPDFPAASHNPGKYTYRTTHFGPHRWYDAYGPGTRYIHNFLQRPPLRCISPGPHALPRRQFRLPDPGVCHRGVRFEFFTK